MRDERWLDSRRVVKTRIARDASSPLSRHGIRHGTREPSRVPCIHLRLEVHGIALLPRRVGHAVSFVRIIVGPTDRTEASEAACYALQRSATRARRMQGQSSGDY